MPGQRFSRRLIPLTFNACPRAAGGIPSICSQRLAARSIKGVQASAKKKVSLPFGSDSTMNRLSVRNLSESARHGTSVVETALVLPVFLLFVLGLIELGHAQMVKHMLRAACRSAARSGTTDGATTAAVRTKALDMLESVVDVNHVDIYVKDASVYDQGGTPPSTGSALEALSNIELSNAEPRQLFLVRAKIHYHDTCHDPSHIS
jgi:hypothetical protein